MENTNFENVIKLGNKAFTLIIQDNDKWMIRTSVWTIENIDFNEAYFKLRDDFEVDPRELYAAIEMMAERQHNTAYFGALGSFMFTTKEDLDA